MIAKDVRVIALLGVLVVVATWGHFRLRERRQRTSWTEPVHVAVLVIGDVSPAAMSGFTVRVQAVARTLDAEFVRHHAGTPSRAFDVEVVGPLQPARVPATGAPRPGIVNRAWYAFDLWRATRAVHDVAPGFQPRAWDVRIYVVAAAEDAPFAEGIGEAGGEVGVIRAGLGGAPLLAATAVMHEVLHTLGATDKYDPGGHARVPEGFVDPDRVPRWPQSRAEIMVGEVPLGPGAGRLPDRADEIGVGPRTAEEIGWRVATATSEALHAEAVGAPLPVPAK